MPSGLEGKQLQLSFFFVRTYFGEERLSCEKEEIEKLGSLLKSPTFLHFQEVVLCISGSLGFQSGDHLIDYSAELVVWEADSV